MIRLARSLPNPLPYLIALGVWLAAASVKGQDAKVITFAEGARLVVIDSGVTGEADWRLDARLRPAGYTYKDLANKRLIVARPPNGTYDILVIDYAAKKTYDFLLVVEGGPGPPPDPTPTPQTLADKINVAFTIDKATGKGGEPQKILLGKLYGTLSQFTDNPILMSVGDAHELLHKLVEATLNGSLPTTAKVCDDYIHSKVTESADTALTAEIRGRYKTTLNELAAAIGGGPGPTPGPSPITEPGLFVLIVEETAERAKLPASQLSILTGTELRDYVKTKNAKMAVLDKDVKEFKDGTAFGKMILRPRTATPWLIISNYPNGGYEGPLPKTMAETMALVRKVGG